MDGDDAPPPPPPPPAGDTPSEAAADAAPEPDDDAAVIERAQKLIAKILETQANPNPNHLHALASMLETQESRYMKESACSCFNDARASHTIGKLGNLVRENDEFYEVISSKLLSENRYSVDVRAAAARLVLSCSSSWRYPLVFDDAVLDNIKAWVMEDNLASKDDSTLKPDIGSEMLKTYCTGLLAIALSGGSQVVEDMLTSGLSAKLMRYLRLRVIGEASSSKKDDKFMADSKHVAVASSIRGKEENRVRICQVYDNSHLDGQKVGDDGFLVDPDVERHYDRGAWREHGIEYSGDAVNLLKSELNDSSSEVAGAYGMVGEDGDLDSDEWDNRTLLDGKSKPGDRYTPSRLAKDDDIDDNARDELSRRRLNRILPRSRLKVRTTEGGIENERILASPNSSSRLGGTGRTSKDNNIVKNGDTRRMVDTKDISIRLDSDNHVKGEVVDERLRNCTIGTRDISELVKKAISAAEAEANRVNAPAEAIKAAGDAAAELVMTAALEAWSNSNDEEAAVSAASEAASTVVDAANITEVSWNANKTDAVLPESDASEAKVDEELEDFFILDEEALARLREKYSVQCLETLGEYVEALGPILHEKGVDVCLALLHRSIKDEEAPDPLALLPEVLKLICALGAHRKFAALFVDRGGMQKLLAVRRVSQTFSSLSLCLFTIGSLQGIMERVCALPSDVVHQVVELALQLLDCPQDQARKNAAIFFGAAFVFRAVLDSFDAQEGLQKMLNLLHGAASVRSGGNSGTLRIPNSVTANDRLPGEGLTPIEKQIAYHTCVALRQYFKAQLLLLVDSVRPNKSSRGIARNNPRAAYKPLDISHEAMDAVFLLIQRDRKIGPALVRARWPAVEKFLASNGHITMLELSQAPPVERYLHDTAQHALGVLHIVTFVPYSRKLIVNATLSNNRVGVAVILDAANGVGYVDPEVIHPALNVLVNLVCPPPSISNKPSPSTQGQLPVSVQTPGVSLDSRERHFERSTLDPAAPLIHNESRERHVESNQVERSNPTVFSAIGACSQTPATPMSSGVVGDRRISLGPGAGCAGLAAQLEQGYRQAREAVRANNGIKTLIQLLNPRVITPLAALDCIRALACRVLLGLARDETIAHILTKLQVGKKLSELIRDSGSQVSGSDQRRWQSELAQVAIELITIVTNSGRASTLAATDAAAPTLRRIERAAIAAATPITYHSRELLQLIHEHLQATGLTATAALLLKEAELTPLPSLGAPNPPLHQTFAQETSCVPIQWPSGRSSCGFHSEAIKIPRDEESNMKEASISTSSKKKSLVFSSTLMQGKVQQPLQHSLTTTQLSDAGKGHVACGGVETQSGSKSTAEPETQSKTPIVLPMKRKFLDSKDSTASPAKRLATLDTGSQTWASQTSNSTRRNSMAIDVSLLSPVAPRDLFSKATSSNLSLENVEDTTNFQSNLGAPTTPAAHLGFADGQHGNAERMTLDSLVVQYLKHQHRQCPAPITTLPPLSLLHPHVCPEPSRSLNAPANVTARVSTQEVGKQYGGIHAHRRDRQFIYSRFRPSRTCRDDSALLICLTFLEDSSRIATGCHSGEIKIFDSNNGNLLESQSGHQSPVTIIQSTSCSGNQLILSSAFEVKLWDASSLNGGPLHSFDGCRSARFSHSGGNFAALSSDSSRREVLIYDVQTCNVELRLPDSSTSNNTLSSFRGHAQSLIHFSPLDTMILWNGTLWDRRSSNSVHRFDQFTDYGGGGFHPAGNEVIINSEVWDLRKFRLLRTVPSLDQTVLTFNGGGDVIYAILRRNLEEITSAVQPRRVRHPLFPAFRTIDAVNYCDIATVQVDRCVLDLATDPTDSFIGVIAMDDHQQMFSSARLYEVGRKRPTDDDSDPDDGGDTDEDEENDESDADIDPILGAELDGDTDSDDDISNEDDEDANDELDEDGEFNLDDFEGGQGLLEIMAEGDEEGDDDEDDDGSEMVESFSSEEEDEFGF